MRWAGGRRGTARSLASLPPPPFRLTLGPVQPPDGVPVSMPVPRLPQTAEPPHLLGPRWKPRPVLHTRPLGLHMATRRCLCRP